MNGYQWIKVKLDKYVFNWYFIIDLSRYSVLIRHLLTTLQQNMKTKDIHQEVHFKAKPMEIYNALMDSKKHAEFTGADADIVARVGGHFKVHGGYINGQNLELVPGKKIVQSWNAEEEYWPVDYYSKVTFELKAEKGGTVLNFTHEGVPVEHFDEIVDGWQTYYWEPMQEMLEE
jgi:uncharacterized protein YndB with AHSA1/START domain